MGRLAKKIAPIQRAAIAISPIDNCLAPETAKSPMVFLGDIGADRRVAMRGTALAPWPRDRKAENRLFRWWS
jgi:hypothetical protein